MTEAEFDRAITILRASWAYFDGVAARVSPEMRKGPRRRTRPRRIIRHAIRVESEDFATGVGSKIPEGEALTPDGLAGVSGGLRRGDARLQRR